MRPITLVINEYSYTIRISLLIAVLLAGIYIKINYIKKTKQNKYQMKFQKMNSEISSEFIAINSENFDETINDFLSKICEFFEVDRTYLFLIDYENNVMKYSNEWCNKEAKPQLGKVKDIPTTTFPWWLEQLKTDGLIAVEDINKIPESAALEREQFTKQGIKSLISVPVEGVNNIQGFLGIDSVVKSKKWSENEKEILKILSNLLSESLTKLKSEQEIEFLAYYDNLTKLPNRFLFKKRVKKAIKQANENKNSISIMFLNIDNFKTVNDTMGHNGGDDLLKQVSQALSKRLAEGDTLARFSGDEFVIMLNNIDRKEQVLNIADNIMSIFLTPFNVDNQEFFVTASCGISTFYIDGEDAETLTKNADIAMHEAKLQGKNRYFMCTTKIKDEVERNMRLSNDLYHVLEREELAVYYQPQVGLKADSISGLEALIRWEHPELGMISPGVFIPLAEKNGLINSIGKWIMKTACAQNKKWQDMGMDPVIMAVNLSGVQFINPYIADDIEKILKETGLEPKYLEVEITENIAIKETDFVVDALNKLKNIGVAVAIDDFGTEYSSLSRLKKLPIDRIKIDMQFIQGIENDKKDQAITMVIINLAKSLGLNVIAEGVETAPQLEFLKENMCDCVQGYYYYKPMPAHHAEEVLNFTMKDRSLEEDEKDYIETDYRKIAVWN